MKTQNRILIGAGVASTLLWLVLYFNGMNEAICWTAAITLLTAILWVTEAIPIPAASLIPLAALPLTGVLDQKAAAGAVGNPVIILLMGAFMLSKALEHSGVHHRFAMAMLRITGHHSAKRLVLGFMLTAAFLSMWISNSATTLMLLPMALAMMQYFNQPRLTLALLLGIAYAASVGGVGTPIGTPPNAIFMSVYQESMGKEVSFVDWMTTGVPVVLLAVPVMALWLTRGLGKLELVTLPERHPWQSKEIRVVSVFALVALAWIFRPVWTDWLGLDTVGDSTIALAGVVLMFIIPNGEKDKQRLLDWKTANDIPWGMLLLFSGGIAIARGFSASGLDQIIGGFLAQLAGLPILLLMLCLTLFVTFLTEITSNTATATLLMPILAVAGVSAGIDPQLLMIPAAISASCAFMLPVATAPNAIVYGSEKISIKEMAREGMTLNVLVALIVTLVCYVTL